MTKQVIWTMRTGKQATVDVELVTEREISLDGDRSTVACCEMRITASIEGMGAVGSTIPRNVAANDLGIVAHIGKLALTAETLALVEAAIAEVKASPAWQAQIAREAASAEAGRKYETGRRAIERAMNM